MSPENVSMWFCVVWLQPSGSSSGVVPVHFWLLKHGLLLSRHLVGSIWYSKERNLPSNKEQSVNSGFVAKIWLVIGLSGD